MSRVSDCEYNKKNLRAFVVVCCNEKTRIAVLHRIGSRVALTIRWSSAKILNQTHVGSSKFSHTFGVSCALLLVVSKNRRGAGWLLTFAFSQVMPFNNNGFLTAVAFLFLLFFLSLSIYKA